ncbi:MAG: hypothetical protein WBM00_02505 [Solirubrobacterales bacterium]
MSHRADRADDAAYVLIEELLRTAFTLSDVIASLLEDLPEDAFPGEDSAAVLIEMIAGSCRPAVEAAGEPGCWAATALIAAVRDRVLEDLRAVADLAGPGQ